MQFKNRLITLIISITLLSVNVSAKNPIRFGKIEIDELKNLVYAPDTSAPAVVICQYGYFDSKQFRFVLTRRVKILKKEGVRYASYIFRGGDNVIVKGRTYNLVNGEIVEEKLSNESIFNERIIDNVFNVRVAMPNVQVGSVIDIETSDLGLPSVFRFQEKIPVIHAEIELEPTEYVEYKKRYIGYIPIKSKGSFNFYADSVPAFKSEKYMSSDENFITKFEFDILQISFPGNWKSFTTSWNAVNVYLDDHPNFGAVLKSASGYLSDIETEIKAKYSNPVDQAKAAYEFVKMVKWNKIETLYSFSSSLGTVFKKRIGNSTEINMILIQLLKKLDIEAKPLVLSTRSNGFLHTFSPSIEKLNYMIVCAKIDGKDFLLDATEKYLPFGQLPERCMNGEGRTVEKTENCRWVPLSTEKRDKKMYNYSMKIEDDLTFKGNLKIYRIQNAAYEFRCKMAEYASNQNFIDEMEAINPGLRINEFKISNIDSIESNSDENYDVEIRNGIESVNDLMFINPFFYNQMTENPFKLDERIYPVDYPFLVDETMVSRIQIPEGFVISEMPKPISVTLPEKSASFLCTSSLSDGVIQVMYKLQINKFIFLPDEYGLLKELYNQVIKKQAQPIILKPLANASNH